jgi:hypothetical protein
MEKAAKISLRKVQYSTSEGDDKSSKLFANYCLYLVYRTELSQYVLYCILVRNSDFDLCYTVKKVTDFQSHSVTKK